MKFPDFLYLISKSKLIAFAVKIAARAGGLISVVYKIGLTIFIDIIHFKIENINISLMLFVERFSIN